MAAPDLLLIKPVSVTPPCITASSGWPSRVNVTLAVSMRDSRCPGMPCREGVYEAGTVTTDLCKPWLLSSFQCGSEYALPRQAPTCVHSSAEEVLVTFRDLEVNAPVPGVISLALCPAAPEHGAGQKATIEAIPLMVGLYAAVMSLVLFVMVAATRGRNALHEQGLWRQHVAADRVDRC
ncbi:hypothetical protein OEZ85_010270 [Tetradesmus obliquus]|uniref:Uncharacterized protein n=1 Tax=Tetradesmus obliquus TaxID=3088 RepID=A0ABY8TLX1_TETOB|nr:hypothetical protein OEZ85_010270 [Tetradesmus obliquus]